MALGTARSYGQSVKWLVSILVIVVVARFGIYGVNWKSGTSVAALLVAIAALALCITLWKRMNQIR